MATTEQAIMTTTMDTSPVQGTLGDERETCTAVIVEQVGPINKAGQAMHFFDNKVYVKVGGQQLTAKCIFCRTAITSTGSTRMVDHLVVCILCPKEVQDGFKALRAITTSKRKEKAQVTSLAIQQAETERLEHEAKQKQLKQSGIKAGLANDKVHAADLAIGEFFYANGLSFQAADPTPASYYINMVRAIQNAPPTYVPPGYQKLSGPILDEAHTKMWSAIRKRDADGKLTSTYGSTYVSDGWDSCDNLPLINSAFITAGDGGVYWRSVDTSGNTKSGEYCAALMIEDIYAFGCLKVILIITDTCNTMRKAWSLVMDEFPWISVLPCQPHCVSLLLKDIGKADDVQKLVKEEGVVVSWFSNHHTPLSILRAKVREKLGGPRELIKAGGTRFGTNTLVGERLSLLKGPLQKTVIDDDYVAQNYKDLPDEVDLGSYEKVTREHKGGTAKKLVLDDSDGGFWSRVATHVAITMPIFKLLRRHDSSAATMGKVYHGWYDVEQHIKANPAQYAKYAADKFNERWEYSSCDFSAAAYVLDPEFHAHQQEKNAEVMEGFQATVQRIGILFAARAKAAELAYEQQWKSRADAIAKDLNKQRTYEHYPTYPNDKSPEVQQFCIQVNAQLAVYRGKKGSFAYPFVFPAAEKMQAYEWWEQYGSSVPELMSLAVIVLSQPASASICERINSEFAFVKDRRRNRLAHEKANKLVGLFHNLRLMKRMRKPMYVEPAIGWNDDENKSGITKFGLLHHDLFK